MSRGTSKKSTGTILLLRTKNLSYLYPNNLVREAGFEPVEPMRAKTPVNPPRLRFIGDTPQTSPFTLNSHVLERVKAWENLVSGIRSRLMAVQKTNLSP